MSARIQRSRRQTTEQKIERARAATQRARVRLAESAGVENEIDIAHAPLSWWRARWQDKAIRRQFIENFIYIRDEFDKNAKKLLKFNEAQADFHEKRTGKDVLLKGRKIGFSTYFLAADLVDAVVLSGREVRNAVQDPDTEKKFREKQFLMYESLPGHLKPATREYSNEQIWIDDPKLGTEDSHLTIRNVAAGHEAKGRGQPFTHLRLTEIPHWQGNQKKIVNSLLEAASTADRSYESTAYGVELFHARYQQGKKRKGGWTSHFYPWWWSRQWREPGASFVKARGKWLLLKPEQALKDVWRVAKAGAKQSLLAANRRRFQTATVTEEEMTVGRLIFDHLKSQGHVTLKRKGAKKDRWQCNEVAEYIAWRRAKIEDIGDDFKVEYPENDVDCFEHTGRPVISPVYLKEPCEPSEPIEGHAYIIGGDSSLGRAGGNPSAIVVIDVDLGCIVHSEKSKQSPDQFAYRVGELSDHYNNAFIVPESNNTGYAVISALCNLGYGEIDRLYRHLDAQAMRRIAKGASTVDEELEAAPFGFPTTFKGPSSKSTAGQWLEESVRKKWLLVDQAFIDEALVVVWFDNETFGPLPGQAHHADLFMATTIANFVMRSRATLSGGFVGVMPEVGYAR